MADLPHITHHVVAHAPMIKPIIFSGVSYMTALIASAVSLASGFGIGWYIKGRGMAGVKVDVANIKTDVANLKDKLSAPATAPTV